MLGRLTSPGSANRVEAETNQIKRHFNPFELISLIETCNKCLNGQREVLF
jgi:hypothetical protein